MAGNSSLGTRASLLGARSRPSHGLPGTSAGLCFCSDLKLRTGTGNHAVCLSLSHLFALSPVFLPEAGLIPFTVAPLDWVQGPGDGRHRAGGLDATQAGQAHLKVPGAQKHAGVTFLSPALSTCCLVQDEGSLEE